MPRGLPRESLLDLRKKRGEKTCKKILDGAERTFLERGYRGTTMGLVAKRAGITQSLIHHHFKKKEELWRVVEERRFREAVEEMKPRLSEAARSDNFILNFASTYFEFLSESEAFTRHLIWYQAQGDLPPEETEGRAAPVAELIAGQQRSGKIRSDIPEGIILVVIWSICEGWHSAKRQYGYRLGESFDWEGRDNEVLDALLRMLKRGFAPE